MSLFILDCPSGILMQKLCLCALLLVSSKTSGTEYHRHRAMSCGPFKRSIKKGSIPSPEEEGRSTIYEAEFCPHGKVYYWDIVILSSQFHDKHICHSRHSVLCSYLQYEERNKSLTNSQVVASFLLTFQQERVLHT